MSDRATHLHPPGHRRADRAARVRRRLRGLPARGRRLDAPAHLPAVRPRRLLRRLPQPARDRPRRRHRAPDHPLAGAGRGVVLVLRRPAGDADPRRSPGRRASRRRRCSPERRWPRTRDGGHARRPAILAVDDEPTVLAAVSRDLRKGFGERYRMMRAGSGPEALELLSELRRRGDAVALMIADQRMPGMEGTEFLTQARQVYPGRQAGAADRLRRHVGGDRRDQRGGAGLLPAQAVGPARGGAVPRRRGSAADVGGRRRAVGRRRPGDRPPLLQGDPRPA